MSLHADNRRRLVARLRDDDATTRGVVLLEGGKTRFEYDTDREVTFQQESFFQWAFGVKEPNFYGALDLGSGRSFLFMPRLPESYAVWMGRIHPPEHFRALYEVDEVRYVDDLLPTLEQLAAQPLYLLSGKNSDSGVLAPPASFGGLSQFAQDTALLHTAMTECRLIKSEAEIALLRAVNAISSDAHVEVMRRIQPGMSEYQLEALFLHEIYARGGCRFSAYTSICGCGPNSSVLHHGHAGAPNDRVLLEGELFLHDAGAEYHGYASDITCTYPVSGRFSADQRAIYEAVLAANRAVQAAMKPGVSWPAMHRLAERTLGEKLLEIGILRGDLDALLRAHAPILFMPHGLGHLLGLDVHDVGGYPRGIERIDEPGLRSLRCGRQLEAGMLITVEPGLYFIDAVLEPALSDPRYTPFLVPEVLKRFRGFGGVRIEDDVLVTATGCENLTQVPRDVDDIERIMAAGQRRTSERVGALA